MWWNAWKKTVTSFFDLWNSCYPIHGAWNPSLFFLEFCFNNTLFYTILYKTAQKPIHLFQVISLFNRSGLFEICRCSHRWTTKPHVTCRMFLDKIIGSKALQKPVKMMMKWRNNIIKRHESDERKKSVGQRDHVRLMYRWMGSKSKSCSFCLKKLITHLRAVVV